MKALPNTCPDCTCVACSPLSQCMRCMKAHPNRQTLTRDAIWRLVGEGMTVAEAEAALGAEPCVVN